MKEKALFALRVAAGSVFIVSGFTKLIEPYQNFLSVIYGYKILKGAGAHALALGLPWVELILGAFLAAGLWSRLAAGGLWGVTSVFALAVASALWRRLPITDCGCFAGAASFPLHQVLWIDAGLWIVLAILTLFASSASCLSLDRFFDKMGPRRP